MKILVIGNGGREHTLAWKINQSPKVEKVYCAPGNAGTALIGKNVPIGAEEIDRLIKWIDENKIDLTLVGPEAPLVKGIVDEFYDAGLYEKGLRIFGPTKAAARLEGSKIFAKEFMARHNIPSGKFKYFDNKDEARDFIKNNDWARVVKADGLAAGKGVIVTNSEQEAMEAVDTVVENFGEAGKTFVVEERLTGQEVSFVAFTDGKTVVPMPASQDHKQIYDGDKGPNTGGMGAYAPAPLVTPKLQKQIMNNVMIPAVRGMDQECYPYKGILYAGLMITNGRPKVLEFNARFGDPETQTILLLMKSDLVEVLLAVVNENLDLINVEWYDKSAVCVVLASKGYPGSYEKGKEIFGLEDLKARDDVIVFHAGTRLEEEKIVTSGGRVLGITGIGSNISDAIKVCYDAIEKIIFDGMYYRKDIGKKALNN